MPVRGPRRAIWVCCRRWSCVPSHCHRVRTIRCLANSRVSSAAQQVPGDSDLQARRLRGRGEGAGEQDLSQRQAILQQAAQRRGYLQRHRVSPWGKRRRAGRPAGSSPIIRCARGEASPPRRGMTARIVLAGGGINRIV
ncbi:hypothetical protein O0544_01530 [Edwardsiella anguillarum]|nr:hypothetical protein [Edwardsiella anguillarum]